jgi:hypothetical protein
VEENQYAERDAQSKLADIFLIDASDRRCVTGRMV